MYVRDKIVKEKQNDGNLSHLMPKIDEKFDNFDRDIGNITVLNPYKRKKNTITS